MKWKKSLKVPIFVVALNNNKKHTLNCTWAFVVAARMSTKNYKVNLKQNKSSQVKLSEMPEGSVALRNGKSFRTILCGLHFQ